MATENQSPMSLDYTARKKARRVLAANHLAERTRVPVTAAQRAALPANAPTPTTSKVVRKTTVYVVAALLIHGGLIALLSLWPASPGFTAKTQPKLEQVMITSVMESVSVPAPQAQEPGVVAPENAPEPAPPEPKSQKLAKAKPIPRDWVDEKPAPADVPEEAPKRRIVGISFGSTVKSGTGPAFAVGNTRMGETGASAEDPSKVASLSGTGSREPIGRDTSGNRVAALPAAASVRLEKPRRLINVTLNYPEKLKTQGIEANVVVRTQIAANGNVTNIEIIQGSGYAEFDEEAIRAARSERFEPAKQNGEPIAYALTYTYRFRIKLS